MDKSRGSSLRSDIVAARSVCDIAVIQFDL